MRNATQPARRRRRSRRAPRPCGPCSRIRATRLPAARGDRYPVPAVRHDARVRRPRCTVISPTSLAFNPAGVLLIAAAVVAIVRPQLLTRIRIPMWVVRGHARRAVALEHRVQPDVPPAPLALAPRHRREAHDVVDENAVKRAAQTFVYGYPLVYDLAETRKIHDGTNGLVEGRRSATASHPRATCSAPKRSSSRPNNDTLYLLAACDVSAGPLVLHVPDTHDRYYVLQFVDAWSNNFAYVGRRATGTKRRARSCSTPPGYTGHRARRHARHRGAVVHLHDRRSGAGERDRRPARGARAAGPVHARDRRTRTRHRDRVPGARRRASAPISRGGSCSASYLAAFPPPAGRHRVRGGRGRARRSRAPTSPYVDPDPDARRDARRRQATGRGDRRERQQDHA